MNNADRTGLDRMNSGVTNALAVDANTRSNFDSQNSAAVNAANIQNQRQQLGFNVATQGSANDLARINAFNTAANTAENSRLQRRSQADNLQMNAQNAMQGIVGEAQQIMQSGDQAQFENYVQTQLLPQLEAAGFSKEQAAQVSKDLAELGGFVTRKKG
jgi:hypothetical protein